MLAALALLGAACVAEDTALDETTAEPTAVAEAEAALTTPASAADGATSAVTSAAACVTARLNVNNRATKNTAFVSICPKTVLGISMRSVVLVDESGDGFWFRILHNAATLKTDFQLQNRGSGIGTFVAPVTVQVFNSSTSRWAGQLTF
jgi:hypothetical protein